MITLDGTQTVSNICRSFNFVGTNCLVNVRLRYGTTITYCLDDARNCLIVYRMKISADSNAVIVDLYTY